MKKKILALALVVAILAIAVIGGTLAYFTDTDYETNVLVSGNVEIEIREDNGEPGQKQEKTEMPPYKKDDAYRKWLKEQRFVPGTTLPKEVWVDNTSLWNDAYIRLYFAVPADLDPMIEIEWNTDSDWKYHFLDTDASGKPVDSYTVDREGKQTLIDGRLYTIYCATYTKPVDAKDSTPDSMLSVTMIPGVDVHHNTDGTYTYYTVNEETGAIEHSYTSDQVDLGGAFILIHARAVQAANFKNWDDAMDGAFGNGYQVNPWAAGEGSNTGALTVTEEDIQYYLYKDIVTTETAITTVGLDGQILVEESNIYAPKLADINGDTYFVLKGTEIDVDSGISVDAGNITIIIEDCNIEVDEEYFINHISGAMQVIFVGDVTINGTKITNANVDDFASVSKEDYSFMYVASDAEEVEDYLDSLKRIREAAANG